MARYIGQSIPRVEDLRLITGAGRYTDDLAPRDALWAVFVRSPHAHARVLSIDSTAAAETPGVVAVFTAADYAADGCGPIRHNPVPADAVDVSKPGFWEPAASRLFQPPQPPLAGERVRFVGEPVAMVLAESLAEARDGAELVEVDYEPLAAVVRITDAMAEDAPALWDENPDNVCLDQSFGDEGRTGEAFGRAACVVEQIFVNSRTVTCQLEPRGAVGSYDPTTGVYRLLAGSQGVVRQRMDIAAALKVPPSQMEVVCPDVGGGFGSRSLVQPEAVLCPWAAMRTGRPVRWTADRSEGFLTDFQGRDSITHAALALDADGRILALRQDLIGAVGAHAAAFVSVANGYRVASTVYDVPTAFTRVRGVMTNTVPTAPYRGAGRPEAHHAIERLLDLAADRLGLDRREIRRRNLVGKAALPYRNPFGLVFDSGDFQGNMALALEKADWDGFEARRAAGATHGLLRGIGLSNYIESPVGAPRERVEVSVGTDGLVTVVAGTQSTGQGHETTFAQVVADQLGVEMDTIRLVTGDTRVVLGGGGTHSDRSMRLAGTLLVEACAAVVAKARALAAQLSGCTPDEVEVDGDLYRPPASNRIFRLSDLAQEAPLSATAELNGRIPAYPTGCAVCELEVDPETGAVTIARYTSIDDAGQLINPMIVEGQVHGGIAQGAGQALFEYLVLDPDTGQVLGGSFMDYGIPRADQLPMFDTAFTEDPTGGNPLRVKGGGEAGITPATACIYNALLDALAPLGVTNVPMPATPLRVWEAIQRARFEDLL